MSSGLRQLTAATAAGVGLALVAGVVVAAVARESEQPEASGEPTSGPARPQRRVFAVSRGDPVDVDLPLGESAERCIATSGGPYLSSRFCDPPTGLQPGGVYTVTPLLWRVTHHS